MSSPDMARVFDAEDRTADWAASYNVAPTQMAPVVVGDDGSRELRLAHFGLVPPWSKDTSMSTRMINARIETVETSRAYKRPFARHRGVVPVSGWYEWKSVPGEKKQPYFFTFGPDVAVPLAGLWERWSSRREEEPLWSFTIITCPAMGEGLEEIHPRMPYVLPDSRIPAWLGEEEAPASELLRGPDAAQIGDLDVFPVSRAVGSVRNNGPDLVRPVEAPAGESGPETLPGL